MPDFPSLFLLTLKRMVAFSALWLERLVLFLWLPFLWCMFFVGLWLFDVPRTFGGWPAFFVSLVFICGLIALLYRGRGYFIRPSPHDVDRFLEVESKVRDRPLTGAKDILINTQKSTTRALWSLRMRNLHAGSDALKFTMPRPILGVRDQYGLRFAILLFAIAGFIFAGSLRWERIETGLFPYAPVMQNQFATLLDIRIVPPDYTQMADIFAQGDDVIEIPENSVIKISGQSRAGFLKLRVNNVKTPFKTETRGQYFYEGVMTEDSHIDLSQFGLSKLQYELEIIKDEAPAIVQKDDPAPLPDGPLRFHFMVYDDYGVETLYASMNIDPKMMQDAPIGAPYFEERLVMSPDKEEFEIRPVFDLTGHPWAGLPVVFNFKVSDQTGQEGVLPPIEIILPERVFSHPVAQSLIAARKKLAWLPTAGYAGLSDDLFPILTRPDTFHDDMVVFLGLRSVISRLDYAMPSEEIARGIMDILWMLALRVEDGNMTMAARKMRNMQSALERALNNPNASQQELLTMMDSLKESMGDFFRELMRDLQKMAGENTMDSLLPEDFDADALDIGNMAQMMDQLENAIRDGETQKAQELMAEMQRMMDQLDPSVIQPMPEDMKMMSKGVDEIKELIERQEDLKAQTEQQANIIADTLETLRLYQQFLPEGERMKTLNAEDGKLQRMAIADTTGHQVEQDALRFVLGRLMLEAGEILDELPENLGLAEHEMRKSADALGENVPADSLPFQEQAIAYLKEAQEQLSQQLAARIKQTRFLTFGGGGAQKYDPLGRPYGEDEGDGSGYGSEVKIPDKNERRRAQDILKKLRERSGEYNRPEEEREYLRRLLKQF